MSEPEIESVSSQIKAWISRIKNLSLEIPNDDLDDSEAMVTTDWQNNHDESHLLSAKIDGFVLPKECLKHNYETSGKFKEG